MSSMGLPAPAEIRATGGGTRSARWRQILADVLATPIVTMPSTEGAAQGAAILAAVGAGWFPTAERASTAAVSIGEIVEPGGDRGRYAEQYARYRDLYPALAPTFKALG
jgi:xylulokinase